jgi:hypothetical protein
VADRRKESILGTMETNPMDAIRRDACFRHEERPAVRRCARCHTPLCADCVIRMEDGHEVCSYSCGDRLVALREEEQERKRLPGWWTRIWTSALLICVLTGLGCAAGAWWSYAELMTPDPERWKRVVKYFVVRFITRVVVGGLIGASIAGTFLWRYYSRRR